MIENVERSLESWTALQRGSELVIKGVVRFPNNFSTSSLHLNQELTSAAGVPHFIVTFGRDKEPFCGPDLIGQVHHRCQALWPNLTRVVINDGEACITVPVRAT